MGLTLITDPEPDSALTRRNFLQGMGAVLAATAAGGGSMAAILRAQEALAATGPTLPAGTPILVAIELNGGNDILNTVIPMSVPFVTGHYRTARPAIGITRVNTTPPYPNPPAGDNLPPANALTDGWALHGALPWLANRWTYFKDVAIVQGTGENVKREMSHFASYAHLWSAAFTGNNLNTGWLGRYNDLGNPGHPLGAISMIGPHDSLRSMASPSVTMYDLASFHFWVDNIPDSSAWLTQLQAMGDAAPTSPNKVASASRAIYDAHQAMATAQGITPFASSGSGGSLAQQLSVVASLINAGMPCQTYVAGIGGFDHHGSEPADHNSKLARLNAGLSYFFSLLNQTSRARDVIVLIYSEFGRQIRQNGSQGTDHGLASSMIVIGGGVKGGFYGQHPSLDPADRYADAMVPTVDFRSLFATLLNRLGGDAGLTETALGRDESNNPFPDLGLWTTGPAKPLLQAEEPPPDAATTDGEPAPTTTSTTSPAAPAPAPSTTTTTAPTTSTTSVPMGSGGTTVPAPADVLG